MIYTLPPDGWRCKVARVLSTCIASRGRIRFASICGERNGGKKNHEFNIIYYIERRPVELFTGCLLCRGGNDACTKWSYFLARSLEFFLATDLLGRAADTRSYIHSLYAHTLAGSNKKFPVANTHTRPGCFPLCCAALNNSQALLHLASLPLHARFHRVSFFIFFFLLRPVKINRLHGDIPFPRYTLKMHRPPESRRRRAYNLVTHII